MYRRFIAVLFLATLVIGMTACAVEEAALTTSAASATTTLSTETIEPAQEVTDIRLSDEGITCDSAAVYVDNDIIYYEAGHDESYGAGSEADAHTAAEAAGHTVVHITQPGIYHVTGELSAGQLFVDLGEDAKTDESARVTLILDGVDITCTVAPAVLFYRVYECGDEENYTRTPDLTDAGAKVLLAEGSTNVVNGSYVAKIYKEGTTDKRYKYDGAFYSRQSMRIDGTGTLNITAENEGLDTELHLQIDGGTISIRSQDDGINTNEDGISVTTINGGTVTIQGGLGEEGDGIDSNGALVINGGTVCAMANPRTGDGGLDADVGIYINGGTVIGSGSRNDEISSDSAQTFMTLTFAQTVQEDCKVTLTAPNGSEVISFSVQREFSALVLSTPELALDTAYALAVDGVYYQYGGSMQGGRMPGDNPPEFQLPADPRPVEEGDGAPPAKTDEGNRPEGQPGQQPPEKPDGETAKGETPPTPPEGMVEASTEFIITAQIHDFYNVMPAT